MKEIKNKQRVRRRKLKMTEQDCVQKCIKIVIQSGSYGRKK